MKDLNIFILLLLLSLFILNSFCIDIKINNGKCVPDRLIMNCNINGFASQGSQKIRVIYGNDVKQDHIEKPNPYLLEDYVYLPNTEGNFSVDFQLFRFQPLTNYLFRFFDNDIKLYDFVELSGSSGNNDFDTKQYLDINGNPTFDLIAVDFGGSYIAIDFTGWLVYTLDLHSTFPLQKAQCKTQMTTNNKERCDRSVDDCNYEILAIVNGTLGYYHMNGTVYNYYDNYQCSFFDQGGFFNHELRRSDKDLGSAYGVRMLMRNISGFDIPQLGQIIEKWDPRSNTAIEITNSFDLFNVNDYPWVEDEYSVNCTDISNINGINSRDWSHINAVSDSKSNSQDGIIVSVRSLSTILLIDINGNIKWQISSPSQMESDFKFKNESNKFYNQHEAQLFEGGRLLLINNNDESPIRPPRSYAAEYFIDFDKRTIELVWEYSPNFKHFFSAHQGGLSMLPNGNVLVCFTSTFASYKLKADMHCVELDHHGNEISYNPLLNYNTNTNYPYRGEHWTTIFGETIFVRHADKIPII